MKYRLYVKFPEQKRFRPVDWANGVQVSNLIHASLFTPEERATLERIDLAHKDNQAFGWEFRPVQF